MKRETFLLGVLGLLFGLPSCRGDAATGSTDPGSATVADTDADGDASSGEPSGLLGELQGVWGSEACETDGTNAFRRTFTFDGDAWDIAFVIYGDPSCTAGQEFIRFDFGGDLSVEGPSDTVDGSTNAFFGFTRRTITPASDAAAAFLVDGAACDGAAWATGTPLDVHADGCATFGVLAADACAGEFDLIGLDGQTLRLGVRPADNNLCEAQLRPRALGATLVRAE